jgi:hypothetical protein
MSDSFARVTLLELYRARDGRELDEVKLRFGFEPARLVGGGYWSADTVPTSERAWEDGRGRPPRFERGKPIDYVMRWSDPEYRSVVVPMHVAMHWFGDWTITPGMQQNYEYPERNYAVERNRVASIWGGYVMERRDRNVEGHWRSLRRIAPPLVPKVAIIALDASQRAAAGEPYNPWTHFAWENQCTKLVPEGEPTPSVSGVYLTPAQISEMVASQVAEALKTANKKQPSLT